MSLKWFSKNMLVQGCASSLTIVVLGIPLVNCISDGFSILPDDKICVVKTEWERVVADAEVARGIAANTELPNWIFSDIPCELLRRWQLSARGPSPIGCSAYCSNFGALKQFTRCPEILRIPDRYGLSVMDFAILADAVEIARYLLTRFQNRWRLSTVGAAIAENRLGVADALIEHEQTENGRCSAAFAMLLMAVQYNTTTPRTIRHFITASMPRSRSINDAEIVYARSLERRDSISIETLIHSKVPCGARSLSWLDQPLWIAIQQKRIREARMLMACGFELTKPADRSVAEQLAQYIELVEEDPDNTWLFDALTDLCLDAEQGEECGPQELSAFAKLRTARVLSAVLQKKTVFNTWKDVDGNSLLHIAADAESLLVTQFLLWLGLSPLSTNNSNETPLDAAISRGNARLAVELALSTTKKAAGVKGAYPIHRAAMYGMREVVPILVARGFDAQEPDSQGVTPLEYAKACGHANMEAAVFALLQPLTKRPTAPRSPSISVQCPVSGYKGSFRGSGIIVDFWKEGASGQSGSSSLRAWAEKCNCAATATPTNSPSDLSPSSP